MADAPLQSDPLDRKDQSEEDEDAVEELAEPKKQKPKTYEEQLRNRGRGDPDPRPPKTKRRVADDATAEVRRPAAVPPAKLREELVQNAVKFLSHPSVKNATAEKKGTFLRDHKGLTTEEVNEAFSRVGQSAPILPPPSASTSVTSSARPGPAAKAESAADPYGRSLPPQPAWSPPPQPTPQQLAMMGYPVPPHMLAGYPPPPGYSLPPAAAAAAAAAGAAGGFGYKTLMLTGLLTAGVAAGAAVLATNYLVKRSASAKPEVPPAIEDKPAKESSRDLRSEIVSEVSKSMKDQTASLTESVQALKALMQASVERKDSELADLKNELLTMKTRMKDLQLQAAVAPIIAPAASSAPSSPAPAASTTTIPAWQQKSALGANRWLLPGANTNSSATTTVTPASGAASSAPAPATTGAVPAASSSTPAPAVASSPASAPAPAPAPAIPSTTSAQPAVSPAPVSGSVQTQAANSEVFQGTSNPPKPADKPPYSSNFQAVMEMVARGQTPPDVKDIVDQAVPPPEPIAFKGAKEVPPKPWERNKPAGSNWTLEETPNSQPASSPPTPVQN